MGTQGTTQRTALLGSTLTLPTRVNSHPARAGGKEAGAEETQVIDNHP